MRISSMRRSGMLVALAALALTLPLAPAGAAETETGTNNLSVPTHFVGDRTAAPTPPVVCTPTVQTPTGSTVDVGGILYYLQQSDARWSAVCDEPAAATVTASWGANLTNDRPLKVGKPIRVEMALLSDDITSTGTGFTVVKLDADAADRESRYGTTGDEVAMPYMVWSSGAHLTIVKSGSSEPVYDGVFGAEINATGKVVYGFNWGVNTTAATAGTYVLTFTVGPGVTITGAVDSGAVNTAYTATTATVTVTVGGGGGGGGSGGGGGGGGGGSGGGGGGGGGGHGR